MQRKRSKDMAESDGPVEDRNSIDMTQEEADAWFDSQNQKIRERHARKHQTYMTPEDTGRMVFCLERIDDFPEDDYCYLHILLWAGINVAHQKIVVFHYPPEYGSVIRAMAKEVPVHMSMFENGVLAKVDPISGQR